MRALLEWFAEVRLLIRCIPHWSVVVWRHRLGRWYVFRDRPDWFVQTISNFIIDLIDDELMRELIVLARAEERTRVDQQLRMLERMLPEYAAYLRAMYEAAAALRR